MGTSNRATRKDWYRYQRQSKFIHVVLNAQFKGVGLSTHINRAMAMMLSIYLSNLKQQRVACSTVVDTGKPHHIVNLCSVPLLVSRLSACLSCLGISKRKLQSALNRNLVFWYHLRFLWRILERLLHVKVVTSALYKLCHILFVFFDFFMSMLLINKDVKVAVFRITFTYKRYNYRVYTNWRMALIAVGKSD
jgi:hypothetical protein